MRTQELIAMLARGAEPVDPARLRRRFRLTLAAAVAAAMAMSAGILHLNPMLSRYMAEPMFWVREIFCVAIGLTGIAAVSRLGRPGRRLGFVPLGAAVPVAIVWALAVAALAAAPAPGRIPLIVGHTARACPLLITLLSVPTFVACMVILRGLAPTNPRRAGAAAGFAAGGVGAIAYTLHCPEIAAPFIAVWYLTGIAIPAAVGAALGPRLLRW